MKKGYIGLGIAGVTALSMIGTCGSDRYATEKAREYVDGCKVFRVTDPRMTPYGLWVGERPKGPDTRLEGEFYDFLRRANHEKDLNRLCLKLRKGVLVVDLNHDRKITGEPFPEKGPAVEMTSEPTGRFADSYGIEP